MSGRDEMLAKVELEGGDISVSQEELLARSSFLGGGCKEEEAEVCSTPPLTQDQQQQQQRGAQRVEEEEEEYAITMCTLAEGMGGKAMAFAAAAAAAAGGGGGKLPPPNPNLPSREDCWSDGETAVLVAAWGSRYIELNRGNLRQKQWREVANAVNSRRGASARRRPPRTDVQCKNRVDTLKKKYKAERARNAPSAWRFFPELDRLVGRTSNGSASKRPSPLPAAQFALLIHPTAVRKAPSPSLSPSPSPPPPMALPVPNYCSGLRLPAAALIQKEAAAAAAALSDSEDSDDVGGNNNSQRSLSRSVSSLSCSSKKRSRQEASGSGDRDFRELARAIEAFAEMYERVEIAKHKQALEMEQQRIDFLKQLEIKCMENFVDAHVKLARANCTMKNAGAAADGAGALELVATVASLPFVSTSTFLL